VESGYIGEKEGESSGGGDEALWEEAESDTNVDHGGRFFNCDGLLGVLFSFYESKIFLRK